MHILTDLCAIHLSLSSLMSDDTSQALRNMGIEWIYPTLCVPDDALLGPQNLLKVIPKLISHSKHSQSKQSLRLQSPPAKYPPQHDPHCHVKTNDHRCLHTIPVILQDLLKREVPPDLLQVYSSQASCVTCSITCNIISPGVIWLPQYNQMSLPWNCPLNGQQSNVLMQQLVDRLYSMVLNHCIEKLSPQGE